MNNKIDYNYVKEMVTKKSNGRSLLLTSSEDFIDKNSILTISCECGNTFQTKYYLLRKIAFQCNTCRNKKSSEKYRHSLEDVKNFIKSKGCEYISGEYINNKSILTIRCSCGNIFEKRYSSFKSKGQSRCQACGKESSRQSKFKYRETDAINILSQKGITLVGDYVDSYKYIDCICSKGHKFSTKLQFVLYNKFGCPYCSKEYQIGENANHYKGGESEVLDNFRKVIKDWKINVAKKYNYVCALTGSKQDCVVHHLVPFKKIIEESCRELNLPLHRKLKDYDINDYKKLETLVVEKHTLDIGVLLQRKVHKKFHSIYGLKGTTIQQFNNFAEKYYNIKIPTLSSEKI